MAGNSTICFRGEPPRRGRSYAINALTAELRIAESVKRQRKRGIGETHRTNEREPRRPPDKHGSSYSAPAWAISVMTHLVRALSASPRPLHHLLIIPDPAYHRRDGHASERTYHSTNATFQCSP